MNTSFKSIAITFVAFLIGSMTGFASNIHSAEITYRETSANVFTSTIRLIVDAKDSAMSVNDLTARIGCPDSALVSNLTLSIQTRKPLEGCKSLPSAWLLVLEANADLSNASFGNLKNCCFLRFDVTISNVDQFINTVVNGPYSSIYVFADRLGCGGMKNAETSIGGVDVSSVICCNQPTYRSFGRNDVADLDSLSYHLITPMESATTSMSYSGSYSSTNPLDYYDPTKKGVANPNANPPIGLFFNPITADFITTPTACDKQSVFGIETVEWRKNTSGVSVPVGRTVAYQTLQTVQCLTNNPPIINSPFSYSVCEGEQLCFNITTDDKVKVPPPPAPAPDPDTVTMKWSRGIPAANFTIVNPNALHQTGRFCWTPTPGQGSKLPYSFVVTARDNACPMNAVVQRAFTIEVHPRSTSTRSIDDLQNGQYAIQAIADTAGRTGVKHTWQLRDSTGALLMNSSKAHFASTGSFLSSKEIDTIVVGSTGKYIVQHTVNDDFNCPTDYFDTLQLNALGVIPVVNGNLKIYPNPVDQLLIVELQTDGLTQLNHVNIYNALGQEVYAETVKGSTLNLDVSQLMEGVYWIEIQNSYTYRQSFTVVH
ncbi:MAG: T9SS type A sorting domain-containing protein [Bacteroidetes bacterium]|nr:T9SS type A sorting domain-containing protein [Bacteroidota bacterium]